MQFPSPRFIEEVLYDETILTIRGLYVDPSFTLSQAKGIFKTSRARLPPANATFRLMWFLGRKHYNSRGYIRFDFPVHESLYADNAWNRSGWSKIF